MVRGSGLNRSRQRGVALLVALVVVAIVASLASWISLSQQVWMRQAENLRDQDQATAVAAGALQFAALSLDQEGQQTSEDDLLQPWAKPLPFFPVAGGSVTGRIEDAEARFNLNNLFHNGSPDAAQVGVFQRLLITAGLSPQLSGPVVAWITPSAAAGAQDVADSVYLGLAVPYRAGSQPFADTSELGLVAGFDHAAVVKLRPWVTALPTVAGVTPINVNTAPAPVLAALFPTPGAASISAVVAARSANPFKSTAQFLALMPPGTPPPEVPYALRSSYFRAVVSTHFGRLERLTEALIYRPLAGRPAQVLWSQRYWPL